MAHFVKIENNLVIHGTVVNNETLGNLEFPESEPVGQAFLASLGFDGTWLQTSYNANFRKNYAGLGFTYDEQRDAFIPPKPIIGEWELDEKTCNWKPVE